jgi:hypothetical protein
MRLCLKNPGEMPRVQCKLRQKPGLTLNIVPRHVSGKGHLLTDVSKEDLTGTEAGRKGQENGKGDRRRRNKKQVEESKREPQIEQLYLAWLRPSFWISCGRQNCTPALWWMASRTLH